MFPKYFDFNFFSNITTHYIFTGVYYILDFVKHFELVQEKHL